MTFFMKITLHSVYFLPTKYYGGGRVKIGISMGHKKTEICLMSEVILPHTVMLRLLVRTIGGQDGNQMPLNVAVETLRKYVMLV